MAPVMNPAPLAPSDCDLRGYDYMPLFGHQLFSSELYTESTDAEFRAALRLWWSAWQQCPAGSLPSADGALALLADYGRDVKGWMKVKSRALHGFVLCADGRLYHPFLCSKAVVAYALRLKSDTKREGDRARLQAWREAQKKPAADEDETPDETPDETRFETPDETRFETPNVEVEWNRSRSREIEDKKISMPVASLPRVVDPAELAVIAWNEMAGREGLSAVRHMTDKRKAHLRHRLADCGGIEGWHDALRLVTESPFLLGQTTDFKADFDFLIQPSRFTKLMEGTYGNRGKAKSQRSAADVLGVGAGSAWNGHADNLGIPS